MKSEESTHLKQASTDLILFEYWDCISVGPNNVCMMCGGSKGKKHKRVTHSQSGYWMHKKCFNAHTQKGQAFRMLDAELRRRRTVVYEHSKKMALPTLLHGGEVEDHTIARRGDLWVKGPDGESRGWLTRVCLRMMWFDGLMVGSQITAKGKEWAEVHKGGKDGN